MRAQLVHRIEIRFAKFGDIGQKRDLHRIPDFLIMSKIGHGLGKDRIRATFHVIGAAFNHAVQPFGGQRVTPRHDDKIGIGFCIYRSPDPVAHFLFADQFFIGSVTTAFLRNLVFHVHGGNPCPLHFLDGAGNVKCPAPANINIGQ